MNSTASSASNRRSARSSSRSSAKTKPGPCAKRPPTLSSLGDAPRPPLCRCCLLTSAVGPVEKIWLILRSEFWRRVRSTSFIVATVLAPIGLLALAVLPAVFGYFASQSTDRRIAVRDETERLEDRLRTEASAGLRLTFTTTSEDSLRAAVRAETYDGYLLLPDSLLDGKGQAYYYSTEGGGLATQSQIES